MKVVPIVAGMLAGCMCIALGACKDGSSRSPLTATTATFSTTSTSPPATTTTTVTTTTTNSPPVPVSVVGDSIAMLVHDELVSALAGHGWLGSVVGNSSTTVETNRERIRAAVAAHPRVVVIELGTNDAGQIGNAFAHPSEADRRAALARTVSNIDGALDDLARIPCVIWVDINDWTIAPFYDVRETAPTINAALIAEASRRAWLHLAPYRQAFTPDDPASKSWLRANFDEHLLHPASAEARTRIAALITDTVHQSCGI